MFKIFRIVVVSVFVVVFAVFMVFFVKNNMETDNTVPVIIMADDVIEVSVNATAEDLLQGVTAYDEKDGDITNKIIVESVSRFIDKGICEVTYAVCDEDNHVASVTRKVVYSDYNSPVFSLSKSLCYSAYEAVDVIKAIDVTDCFDGSLKSSIVITSQDYQPSSEGVFSIDISVTNSKGDAVKLTLPLIVEDRSLTAPKIELKEYLVYTKKGRSVDINNNIISAVNYKKEDLKGSVTTDTNLDVNAEGVYTVHYYVTDDKNNRGHSVMYVVVES